MGPTDKRIGKFGIEPRELFRVAGLSIPWWVNSHGAEDGSDPAKVADSIEIHKGRLPVILCAPHGGRERPDHIPNRTRGVFAFDTNTQELASACADTFKKRFGQPIHLVICKLHRTKLDCNREPKEATNDHSIVLMAWERYHAAIAAAARSIREQYGSGLLIDLHGHGHKSQTLELGYGLEAEELALPESSLDSGAILAKSTLRHLVKKKGITHSLLLRGASSLGALLEKAGYRASPSPSIPVPTTPFFSGGYTIRRHTSEHEHLTGIQIETHSAGVRDSAPNRQAFSEALATACTTFLKTHLDHDLPTNPSSPDKKDSR